MLDLSSLKKEHFTVKTQSGDIFELNPPKIKVLRKAEELSSSTGEKSFEDLACAVATILSGNKTGKKVTEKYVEDNLDIDDIDSFLKEYFKWITRVRKNPN